MGILLTLGLGGAGNLVCITKRGFRAMVWKKKWFGGSKEPKDTINPPRGGRGRPPPPAENIPRRTVAETANFKVFALPSVSMAESDDSPPPTQPNPDKVVSKDSSSEKQSYTSIADRRLSDPWSKDRQREQSVNIYAQGYNAVISAQQSSSTLETNTGMTSSASANFDNSKFRKYNEFWSTARAQAANAAFQR